MKKILVPTDFSDLSEFAYGVASKLAQVTKADIITLSVIPGPQGAIYNANGELTNDEGNDYSEWTKRLNSNKVKMKKWISNKPDVIDNINTIGSIDDSILQYSESSDIDLIVMGTEGLYNKSFWSKGSHTEYITNHSDIPVLSLKCDRSNLDLKEIVLASDFLENEKLDLSLLKTIQKAYDSKLILLKVNTPKQNRSNDQIADDMQSFADINDLENYSMYIYNDSTVEIGIGKFSAENDIDLIALGTHQEYGFSKLFSGSISDDVVNHLFHPILTFPLK